MCGHWERGERHARRCVELCQEHGSVELDVAFAYEAQARAAREQIEDAEDREQLDKELATIVL